jgi:hypothetical protein
MRSHRTERFRRAFADLPENVQSQAERAYRLFQQNPHHPSLHWRQVHPSQPIYSVRIGLDYRALGVREGEVMVWFWIGSHEDYDKLLARMA